MRKTSIALTILMTLFLFNAWNSGGRSQFLNFRLKGQDLNDEQFIEWINKQPSYNGLIQLKLDDNRLTAKSLEALGDSDIGVPYSISLANNPIGDDGAKTLGSASKFSGTAILSLPNTKITAQGLKNLFGRGSLLAAGFLMYLDLSKNDLGDTGVEIIAQSPGSKHLTDLYLDSVGMTDLGAKALAASPNFGEIRTLSISGNKLTADGVSAVRKSKNFSEEAVFYFGEEFE